MAGFDLEITDGVHVCRGWLTDQPIIPSGGYGGHPTASRPKKVGLTLYEGRQPFILTVPMLLFRGKSRTSKGENESVEKEREQLEIMATSIGEHEEDHPPDVTIDSAGNFPLPIPPMLGGTTWWIEDLAWGEEHRNSPDAEANPGHITWKLVTVTLLERIDDETIGQKKGGKTKTSRSHKYRVRVGDTLQSIAKKELGNADKWQEIAKLNGIRSNGHLKEKVGSYIKLPSKKPPAKKPVGR